MLPSRALCLIRDYAKPMTRPEWRNSKPIITTYRLYLHIIRKNLDYSDQTSSDIHLRILWKIQDTDWYHAYGYVRCHGLNEYLYRLEPNETSYQHADGIQDAIKLYKLLLR
jgi:hypothetical protein